MLIPRRQVVDRDEQHLGYDRIARSRFTALCIGFLALGVIGLLGFLIGHLPDLYASVDVAESVLTARSADAANAESPEILNARSSLDMARSGVRRGWIRITGLAGALLVIGYFLFIQRRHVTRRAEMVAASTFMIVLVGGLLLATQVAVQKVLPDYAAWGLLDLFLMHFVACAILPWRPWESVPPFALLLLVWTATFLVPHNTDFEILDRVFAVLLSPGILVPGALLAAWRWRRGEEDAERQALGEQVATIGGELSRARIVHDAMFPDSFDTGHVRFEYDYRPIAEIGGDYVHVSVCDDSGRIYLTLLDVAGHGLAAALTVNRLFGELERIRAEDPGAEPGTVMELLNRYINLTMAAHSLYATGLCLMVDPRSGELSWVNAGHPPSIVRKADGRILELPGTSMLLGALDPREYEPNQKSMKLDCGDVVITYTDGAFEARNVQGQRFGLDALRETAAFNPPPRDWSKFISNAVENHHGGHAEDDVLVASLTLKSLSLGEVRSPATTSARPARTPAR